MPILLYNGEGPWDAPVSLRDWIHPGPAALNQHLSTLDYVFLDENPMRSLDWADERNLAGAIFRLEQSRGERDLKAAVDVLYERLGPRSRPTWPGPSPSGSARSCCLPACPTP